MTLDDGGPAEMRPECRPVGDALLGSLGITLEALETTAGVPRRTAYRTLLQLRDHGLAWQGDDRRWWATELLERWGGVPAGLRRGDFASG